MLTFSLSFPVLSVFLCLVFDFIFPTLYVIFAWGIYTTWYLKLTILQFVFLFNKPCTLNRITALCISHPTLEVIISPFSAFHSPSLESCLSLLFSSWGLFSLSLSWFFFLFLPYRYSLTIRSTSCRLRFPYFLSEYPEYPAYITLEKWSSNATFMVSCFTLPPADNSRQSDSVPWLCPPFWICLSFHHSSLFTFITFKRLPALYCCLTDLCLGAFLMVFPP